MNIIHFFKKNNTTNAIWESHINNHACKVGIPINI